jgi:hypothetical protein
MNRIKVNEGREPSRSSPHKAGIRLVVLWSLVLVLLIAVVAAGAWFDGRHTKLTEPMVATGISDPGLAGAEAADRPPSVHFTDITEQAGIDFVHVNGAYGERLMPETIGSGAAFFDYDNDGDPDLLLVNSRYWAGHEGSDVPHQRFYRNDGEGRFTDVTEQAGLKLTFFGMGAAVGDYDNDGWRDLFIATVGENRLFHNEGGHFREVTREAGVAGLESDWSSSAAFVDYDADGDLDLFVVNYVKWSRDIDLEIDFRLMGLGRAYGAPNHFVGTNSFLYRNDGAGRFSNVSRSAGIEVEDRRSGAPVGMGLGIAPADYDRDGHIDLFISNDTVRNFLFHNLGDGHFEEIGVFEGIGYDRDGKATGGMGIDIAYYRNDLDLGLVVGNFANEMSSLFSTADRLPPFADEAILEGLGSATRLSLTFGVFFFDYDLDGRLDLFHANGHLEHEISKVQPNQHYAQPAQLFWNCGSACSKRLVEVDNKGALAQPMVGRGAAYADIDGDGDLDILITQNGHRAVLLRNDQELGNHWLRVRLIGNSSNRDAIGARVELTAEGTTQLRRVMPSRSFMSQVELPVTFGLGKVDTIERLRIIWPDGSEQQVKVSRVDTTLTIEQPPKQEN